MRPLLTISQLARQTGISTRTIRFWSEARLIPVAQRTAARYRLYDAQAVARLDLLHTLRELGLGLHVGSRLASEDHLLHLEVPSSS
jgi:DNA-binding transcriptional MerR regulator